VIAAGCGDNLGAGVVDEKAIEGAAELERTRYLQVLKLKRDAPVAYRSGEYRRHAHVLADPVGRILNVASGHRQYLLHCARCIPKYQLRVAIASTQNSCPAAKARHGTADRAGGGVGMCRAYTSLIAARLAGST
jgi:hypothetical protein